MKKYFSYIIEIFFNIYKICSTYVICDYMAFEVCFTLAYINIFMVPSIHIIIIIIIIPNNIQ
jgi:hypothetical protein